MPATRCYAIPFSFAYVSSTAGTGALILFGSVQMTMMVAALRSGERPRLLQWVGLASALAGLAYLVSPGLAAPPAAGAALMTLAGRAAVQLTVPVLAGAGGTLILSETLTARLVLSAAIVLGGIALTLVGREQPVARTSTAA